MCIVGERVAEYGSEFVVLEVAFPQVRALLEYDDAETCGGKFLSHYAAGRARRSPENPHDPWAGIVSSLVPVRSVVITERRSKCGCVFEADQLPADPVAIASILRI